MLRERARATRLICFYLLSANCRLITHVGVVHADDDGAHTATLWIDRSMCAHIFILLRLRRGACTARDGVIYRETPTQLAHAVCASDHQHWNGRAWLQRVECAYICAQLNMHRWVFFVVVGVCVWRR